MQATKKNTASKKSKTAEIVIVTKTTESKSKSLFAKKVKKVNKLLAKSTLLTK